MNDHRENVVGRRGEAQLVPPYSLLSPKWNVALEEALTEPSFHFSVPHHSVPKLPHRIPEAEKQRIEREKKALRRQLNCLATGASPDGDVSQRAVDFKTAIGSTRQPATE